MKTKQDYLVDEINYQMNLRELNAKNLAEHLNVCENTARNLLAGKTGLGDVGRLFGIAAMLNTSAFELVQNCELREIGKVDADKPANANFSEFE